MATIDTFFLERVQLLLLDCPISVPLPRPFPEAALTNVLGSSTINDGDL